MCVKNVKHTLQKTSIFALILVLTLMCTMVTSCKDELVYDEAEVLTEANRLLKMAEVVNSIFYGNGIAYVPGLNQNGIYCEADYNHLYSLDLRTLTDMKKLCVDTYSVSMSQMVFSATTDVTNDGSGLLLARYYTPAEEPERLMVNTSYNQIFDDKMTYDYNTLKIVGTENGRIKLTVMASVMSTDENKTEAQSVEIRILLIKEENGYRIDNFVFANYNDTL